MDNNYCIIMAGGVGSRFWPYSTDEKPKQFLDFQNSGRSMIQMTCDRLKGIIKPENIVIVTNRRYHNMILEQLPEVDQNNVLTEPLRRNTAPCIAYATYRIARRCKNANIAVLPSDHLVANTEEFRRVMNEGLRFTDANDALLTLGVKPSRPETGYGYIQFAEGEGELRKVKTFTEKPNREMAEVFVESGEFCWNAGIFVGRAEVMIEAYRRLLPEMAECFEAGNEHYYTANEQKWIDQVFPALQNISIDYGIMEKAENVYVLLSDFGWSDMGTWSSLYELSPKDEQANSTVNGQAQFYRSRNNLVVIGDEEMAVIDGLEGYLVAHSNGKLLICKKDDEARIRQFVDNAKKMITEK